MELAPPAWAVNLPAKRATIQTTAHLVSQTDTLLVPRPASVLTEPSSQTAKLVTTHA